MALSVLQLAAAMRQGDGVTELVEPLLSIITRLQGVGEATVDLLAPDAPVAIKDEAIIRYAAYLYDTPSGTSGDRYAASWRNSGAGALVAGWVIRRVADAEALAQGGGGGGGGEGGHFFTAVPAASLGVDGDTALVRVSSIVLHAYRKVAGTWVRQWAFSGGDSVLLAGRLAAIPDRTPAQDPAGTFSRYIGLSGYSPVTDADITMAQRPINSVSDFRGGLFGTSWAADNDTLPFQSVHANLESAAGNLQIGAAVPFYLWFGLPPSVSGLDIASVSYNGVDIPVTKQANAVRGRGEVQI